MIHVGFETLLVKHYRVQNRREPDTACESWSNYDHAFEELERRRGAYDPETDSYANPDGHDWELLAVVDA